MHAPRRPERACRDSCALVGNSAQQPDVGDARLLAVRRHAALVGLEKLQRIRPGDRFDLVRSKLLKSRADVGKPGPVLTVVLRLHDIAREEHAPRVSAHDLKIARPERSTLGEHWIELAPIWS